MKNPLFSLDPLCDLCLGGHDGWGAIFKQLNLSMTCTGEHACSAAIRH
jgi:hypothetical protein